MEEELVSGRDRNGNRSFQPTLSGALTEGLVLLVTHEEYGGQNDGLLKGGGILILRTHEYITFHGKRELRL